MKAMGAGSTELPEYAMARIRSMHPGAPLEEDVATMTLVARYVWAYLPCHADREGRLRDSPFSLRLLILPTEPPDSMEAALSELARNRHVIRYEVDGRHFLQIRNFARYQRPHPKEAASEIPPPPSSALVGASREKVGASREKIMTSPSSLDLGSSLDPVAGAEIPSFEERDPDPAGAPAHVANGKPEAHAPNGRSAQIWGTADWLKRYGIAWAAKYQQLAYGMPGDSKACASLGDTLGVLPESEKLAAQAKAEAMFREFLESSDPRVVSRRHPFAFFVQEWGGLRVEKKAAEPSKFEPPGVRAERERRERQRQRHIESLRAMGGGKKP